MELGKATIQETAGAFYATAAIQYHKIDDATIAVRTFGEGPPIVFIHGFIVHGYTWRKILPVLAKNYTCHVVDMPGFGNSKWTSKTDFSFTAQAKRLNILFKKLNLESYNILAHDTGASIARILAYTHPDKIKKLILINTEIPNHRPPFIPMHQFLAKLPLANFIFRTLLKVDFIVHSPLLLNQFFYDKSLLKNEATLAAYLNPLKHSKNKMFGMLGYLKGIDWKIVDGFSDKHKNIKAETLILWGENDKTFPVALAENMSKQFSGKCTFIRIPSASLMPHEEKPEEILKHAIPFLSGKG